MTSPTVRERGRIDLMARFCEACWNVFANEMAMSDGATAPPRPEPDPDDVSRIEPPTCPKCGAFVSIYPTTYDRWVSLSTVEMPAKDVPEPFRWRLMRLPGQSRVTTDIVAVRVRGIDPLPGEPVVPAHRMMCVPEPDEP
ncbi:DUF6083 domain-containing protein [Streptomyces antibioticus]|uniref:DUF6083 domain-containing protein n=1 Tax=Streptomyces antibioticus TaxID=1890 RepID=UPI0022540961|nr:DUF6083 domain-containing protein [Streptomyces antibioticus]MCX5169057.1 DUF6083 domain-containing protein [Streptomyces antibioticus]